MSKAQENCTWRKEKQTKSNKTIYPRRKKRSISFWLLCAWAIWAQSYIYFSFLRSYMVLYIYTIHTMVSRKLNNGYLPLGNLVQWVKSCQLVPPSYISPLRMYYPCRLANKCDTISLSSSYVSLCEKTQPAITIMAWLCVRNERHWEK
jgi:hypothetical protein